MEVTQVIGVILTIAVCVFLILIGEIRENYARKPDTTPTNPLKPFVEVRWHYVGYFDNGVDEVDSPLIADAIGVYLVPHDRLPQHLIDLPVEFYEHMPSFTVVLNQILQRNTPVSCEKV